MRLNTPLNDQKYSDYIMNFLPYIFYQNHLKYDVIFNHAIAQRLQYGESLTPFIFNWFCPHLFDWIT